jgi:DNA-binding NarL/FixJ family response regulator
MFAAVTQGEEMTIDEAIAYALGDGADEPSAAARPGPVGAAVLLTPREWQICELVSEGLSNRELASRLVISPRTAESHVQNVMTKLGCSSRARIAAWTAARRREREFTPPGDA